jgi:hypothetical protein
LRAGKVISVKELNYIFKAIEKGTGEIGSVAVRYKLASDDESRIIRSESIEVEVLTPGQRLLQVLFPVVVIVAGGVFALGLVVFVVKRRGVKRELLEQKRRKNLEYLPEQEVLTRLSEIQQHRIAGDVDKYYTALAAVVRDYIRGKYSITVEGKSPEELRQLFDEQNVPLEMYELSRELAELAEKVKFGGYTLDVEEGRKIYEKVEKYFKQHMPRKADEDIELVDSTEQ